MIWIIQLIVFEADKRAARDQSFGLYLSLLPFKSPPYASPVCMKYGEVDTAGGIPRRTDSNGRCTKVERKTDVERSDLQEAR
jgi:hypothetical protein